MKHTFYTLLLLALLMSGVVHAQSSLSIVDALPPYDLTATLLANGHFSLSTRYTDSTKTIIYREDGSSGRPINYTSHIHFKVDNVVFQLPFEENPVTRMAPPDHPLTVTQLFRDTLVGRARINARMFGIMPDGDTVRFLFTMEPVKRPSGGFIRLSAAATNSTAKTRSIGALMLIDTKIGANDQAPIITAFGYRSSETGFDRATPPFIPPFWLAIEGTPTAPGLTARGNLRDDELIEPDLFIFGNWTDYTAQMIRGLASVLWDERTASNLLYTDSAVLLLWQQQTMFPGLTKLLAATEIGIVDSLTVSSGSGGGYGFGMAGGGGGGGGAGGGGCLSVDTLHEVPCGAPGYHPYSPDTLQNIYLVTNTGTKTAPNVRVVTGLVPRGLNVVSPSNAVIPSTIAPSETGVAAVSVAVLPRLQAQSYTIPIAVVADVGDTVIRSEMNVCVPGLMGTLSVRDAIFPPVCPNQPDTIDVVLSLKGARCLPIESLQILGAASDVALYSLVTPLPTIVPSDGQITVRVRYQPTGVGSTNIVQLAAAVRDFESLAPGDTTFGFSRDTATITGFGKDAEYAFARTIDTLDFGHVCVGDTSIRDWQVTNVGGCSLQIFNNPIVLNAPSGTFDVVPGTLPATIGRANQIRFPLTFTPTVAGPQTALLIIQGDALPGVDTLVLRGVGDIPRYDLAVSTVSFDTICPGVSASRTIQITNPTACPVTIDSVVSPGSGFTVAPTRSFTIPPFSSVPVAVSALLTSAGPYNGVVQIQSKEWNTSFVPVAAVVANRRIDLAPSIDFGDVRLRQSGTQTVTLQSSGDAGIEISRIYLAGVNSSEYTITLPAGITLPYFLPPASTLTVRLDFAPGDLETRRAAMIVEATPGKGCDIPEPVAITGRGVLPVIDVPYRTLDFGRICVGQSIDTIIAVRNVGNAPLTISGVTPQGSSDIAILDAPPIAIAVGESQLVHLRFTPTILGDIGASLRIASDGDWLTPPDTVVQIKGTGVLCGTLSLDTVHANIGTVADIPLRFAPRSGLTLTATDVADLMNRSGQRSFRFSIGNDARRLRFLATLGDDGMVRLLSPDPTSTIRPDGITVTGDNASGNLFPSPLLALLRADVLLGDGARVELPLTIEEFAGGYSQLDARNGLLVAEYCAIDRRYIDASGITSFSRPTTTPLRTGGTIQFYLAAPSVARLSLVDALGRTSATLYNGDAAAGMHSVTVASVASGVYTIVLESGEGRVMTPVVVVE